MSQKCHRSQGPHWGNLKQSPNTSSRSEKDTLWLEVNRQKRGKEWNGWKRRAGESEKGQGRVREGKRREPSPAWPLFTKSYIYEWLHLLQTIMSGSVDCPLVVARQLWYVNENTAKNFKITQATNARTHIHTRTPLKHSLNNHQHNTQVACFSKSSGQNTGNQTWDEESLNPGGGH